MSLRSILRLRDYGIRSERGALIHGKTLDLTVRSPVRAELSLREVGSDILTFNEVIKEQVYKDVLTHVKRCRTAIDLGANIGLASLYFANQYPECRVLAVEPNPNSYDILITNLSELIAAGRCKTLKAGVWSTEKVLVADSSARPDHYSAFATRMSSICDGDQTEMIGLPMTTIIAESGFERIDLLKVDIEGAEIELFSGDVDWLRKIEAIAIEFHGDSRKVCNFDERMCDYGFEVIDANAHTVLAVKHRD